MSVTYPLANPLKRTPHQTKFIEHLGVTKYTVVVEKENHCKSDIMITTEDREIRMENVPFSKFNVSYWFYATLIVYSYLRHFQCSTL